MIQMMEAGVTGLADPAVTGEEWLFGWNR